MVDQDAMRLTKKSSCIQVAFHEVDADSDKDESIITTDSEESKIAGESAQ